MLLACLIACAAMMTILLMTMWKCTSNRKKLQARLQKRCSKLRKINMRAMRDRNLICARPLQVFRTERSLKGLSPCHRSLSLLFEEELRLRRALRRISMRVPSSYDLVYFLTRVLGSCGPDHDDTVKPHEPSCEHQTLDAESFAGTAVTAAMAAFSFTADLFHEGALDKVFDLTTCGLTDV